MRPPADTHRGKPRRFAIALVSALLGFFLIDAAIFRSSFYPSILDPESTAGRLENIQYMEMHRRPSQHFQVLAFGDSRMGFLPHLVNDAGRETSVEFASVAVPGSSPRCWYYQLRDLDPEANRYRALILPVDDYDDEDQMVDPSDYVVDVNYLIGRLRLSDVFDFSGSFGTWENRWKALRGTLLKSTVYKSDFQAFLLAPADRVKKVRLFRSGYESWYGGFSGDDGTLDGLEVNWEAASVKAPPDATPAQEKVIRDVYLRPPAPQNGRLASYRRLWFGRIIDRYRGTATQVFFFRLPRGPIPRPDWMVKKQTSSIRELAARPNVTLLDEHTFESLERTGLFKDPLHLNSEGMKLFSRMLADQVRPRVTGVTAHALQ